MAQKQLKLEDSVKYQNKVLIMCKETDRVSPLCCAGELAGRTATT